MRIIAGRHRGRRLEVPRSDGVRPTADRVRQAVFNILEHSIPWRGMAGALVVDVFAGSGACGLEALSRGASLALFIERNPRTAACISRNIAALGEQASAQILPLDASHLPASPGRGIGPFTLTFLDPPYRSDLATVALFRLARNGWLAADGIIVVESARDEPWVLPQMYEEIDWRIYGKTCIRFLRHVTLEQPKRSIALTKTVQVDRHEPDSHPGG